MILKVHLDGAACYDVGDEIWQEPLADALHAEAETIAGYAGSDLLESPDQAHRDALNRRLQRYTGIARRVPHPQSRATPGCVTKRLPRPPHPPGSSSPFRSC